MTTFGVNYYLHAARELHELLGILFGAVPFGHGHTEELQRSLKVSLQEVILRRLMRRQRGDGLRPGHRAERED